MIPINKVLTKIDDEYENEIKSKSGFKLILNDIMKDAKNIVKHGVVEEPPKNNTLGVQRGDIIYFHHNEIRKAEIPVDGKIQVMPAPADFLPHLKLYLISPKSIYVIQRGDDIIEVDPYCFIEPYNTKQVDESKYKHVIIPESVNNIESDKLGIVRYGCKSLRDRGINEGDLVGFTRYSKYEFPIKGDRMFRMKAEWIIYKVKDEQKTIIS